MRHRQQNPVRQAVVDVFRGRGFNDPSGDFLKPWAAEARFRPFAEGGYLGVQWLECPRTKIWFLGSHSYYQVPQIRSSIAKERCLRWTTLSALGVLPSSAGFIGYVKNDPLVTSVWIQRKLRGILP